MKFIQFRPESDPIDLKAEIVASEIIRNGVKEEDVSFSSKSSFKRQFEKDVQSIQAREERKNSPKSVTININREGIYDMLPEGLFHFDDENTKERAKKEGVTVTKLKKRQEAEARKFFQPIENEFYHLLTRLQLKESENLSYFTPEVNRNLFYQIYGYLPVFNDNQIAKLLYFLPLAYKLKGNLRMIEYILQNLLNKDITLHLSKKYEIYEMDLVKPLNKMQLNVDSVVGSGVELFTCTVIIDIHDLRKEEVASYFKSGVNYKIIEKVMSFFLPVNYFYKVCHFFDDDDKYTFTELEENKSFLGYNSWI